jgi:hypothetical protein
MATRNKRRRTVLAGAIVLGAAASAAGMIWLSAAGAGSAPEPAALATKGTFKSEQVASLAAESTYSSIRGSELEISRGESAGTQDRIGGGEEVIAAITGSLTPVAVESHDGDTIVYSSWQQLSHPEPGALGQGLKVGQPVGVPSVRIHEANGKDQLIERGAYSPTLSLDGRVAFVRGDSESVRQNVDYAGKIVVGQADGTSFEPWTSESARYFPYAWAGSTLIAYKALPESEAADVYAFTGPSSSHLLAPEAFVIAISPNGSRLLVTVGRRMVEVVRVADGAIEASMTLDGSGVAPYDSPTTPHALMFAGSWYGNRVVANSDLGLVVLNIHDGIRIESLLKTPGFPTGITEPTLLDNTHLIGWADLGSLPGRGAKVEPAYDNALVECDVASQSCTVGAPSVGRIWTRWVTNPSR